MTPAFRFDEIQLRLTLAAIELHNLNVVVLRPRGKKPAGDAWLLTASADVAEAHLAAGSNLGLLCGPASGIAVLDFDKLQAAEEMASHVGALVVTVVTGSGKCHVYFLWEPGLPAKIRWRGQIIGEIQRGPTELGQTSRQQVVMPPSIHPVTGKGYAWAVNPLKWNPEPLPVKWREYLKMAEPAIPPSRAHQHVRRAGDDLPSASEIIARAAARSDAKRRSSGAVKFQCPKCAADGHDKHRDNAAVMADGRWGCAYAPGDREHRRAIGRALGVIV